MQLLYNKLLQKDYCVANYSRENLGRPNYCVANYCRAIATKYHIAGTHSSDLIDCLVTTDYDQNLRIETSALATLGHYPGNWSKCCNRDGHWPCNTHICKKSAHRLLICSYFASQTFANSNPLQRGCTSFCTKGLFLCLSGNWWHRFQICGQDSETGVGGMHWDQIGMQTQQICLTPGQFVGQVRCRGVV